VIISDTFDFKYPENAAISRVVFRLSGYVTELFSVEVYKTLVFN